MSTKQTMVTLVHGTWGEEADWVREESRLWTALEAAGYEPKRATWKARNRFTDRREGAIALRQHVAKHPDYEHVVVAHSHGGNLAIWAADGDDSLFKGLICLNTPFLNALRRHTGAFENIGVAVTIAGSFAPLGLGLSGDLGWWTVLFSYVAIAVAMGALALFYERIETWMVKRGQNFRPQPLAHTPIYCLNTPDDEAYGALAFFASLQNFVFLLISTVAFVNRPIGALIGGLVLFEGLPFLYVPWDLFTSEALYTRELYDALLSSTAPENPWRIPVVLAYFVSLYLLSSVYFYAFYALAVLGLLVTLSIVVTTSQGLFAPLSGLFNRFLVTLVPLNSVNTEFEEVEGDATELRHSALYSDERTITRIIDWIEKVDRIDDKT